jgi:hypothetical protein
MESLKLREQIQCHNIVPKQISLLTFYNKKLFPLSALSTSCHAEERSIYSTMNRRITEDKMLRSSA